MMEEKPNEKKEGKWHIRGNNRPWAKNDIVTRDYISKKFPKPLTLSTDALKIIYLLCSDCSTGILKPAKFSRIMHILDAAAAERKLTFEQYRSFLTRSSYRTTPNKFENQRLMEEDEAAIGFPFKLSEGTGVGRAVNPASTAVVCKNTQADLKKILRKHGKLNEKDEP